MIYINLEGEELDLAQLNKSHRDLLKEVYDLYQKASYNSLHNAVFEAEYLKRMGAKQYSNRHYVDGRLSKSLIYRIIIDLVDRKAIQEGILGLGENSSIDFSRNKKNLEDFLS
jgi:hypothetical protein